MEQLKQNLVSMVNQSDLPFEAIYYVVKDFFRDVDDTYKLLLKQQAQKNIKEENIQEEE